MRIRLRSAFTFANVCSFLALTVALGTGGAYAANTVFSTDIVNGEVKAVDLGAGAVTNPKIANNAVDTAKLADGAVTRSEIAMNAVDADRIVDQSVGSAEVADASLTALDLGANSVGQAEIFTAGVGASEIEDDSIDGGEVADGSLTGADIASNSVTGDDIADSSLLSSDIAPGSLYMSDLYGADVSGHISLSAGAVALGRCKDFTLSITGAAAGQAVLMSVQAAIPAGVLLYTTRVPASSEATMAACNFTGGTFPALNNIPIRLYTFG